jgi:hypothetical protein
VTAEHRGRKHQQVIGCSIIGSFMICTAQIFNDEAQITESELSHHKEHKSEVRNPYRVLEDRENFTDQSADYRILLKKYFIKIVQDRNE